MPTRAGYQASVSETTVANLVRTRRPARRASSFWALVPALLLLGLIVPLPFGDARAPVQIQVPLADSVPVIAGARYRAGALHRFLLGTHYRELWTTPIVVPVLRAERFDGGLLPVREGGGDQTRSLHFRSGTGREFVFRSTDKVVRLLPRPFDRSVLGWVVQDGISASHPGAPLVAFALHAAIGIPGQPSDLVVLAEGGLGIYRDRYAGLLGTFQEEVGDSSSRYSTEDVLVALDSNTRHRVDATGFLAARLLDFVLNDWDRHLGQWHWTPEAGNRQTIWHPIPVDRDQAFSWYDGLVVDLLRLAMPKLVKFGPEFPRLSGLTSNSRETDRRFLASLSREQWDSVTRFVQDRLSDSVLSAAVRRLPHPWLALSGAFLEGSLQQRRDGLGAISRRFYALLH